MIMMQVFENRVEVLERDCFLIIFLDFVDVIGSAYSSELASSHPLTISQLLTLVAVALILTIISVVNGIGSSIIISEVN